MHSETENQIAERVMKLSSSQQDNLLSYIERIPMKRHSSKLYKKKAMKQIRQALQEA